MSRLGSVGREENWLVFAIEDMKRRVCLNTEIP